MYELKKIHEDFIVDEVPSVKLDGGKYCIFLMSKRNYNTEDVAIRLANYFKIPRKNIGYAGAKDKHAITTQYISIQGVSKGDVELTDITLKYIGNSNEPISLGNLAGNKFKITIRNLENENIIPITQFVNYFDEQRFSKNNAEVGRAVIKKEYEIACKLLLEDNSNISLEIKSVLEKNPRAFLNAIKTMPRKVVLIYVHAYQSLIWNKVVEKLEENKIEIEKVPLPGFDIVIDEKIEIIYKKALEDEKITLRDFIQRDFPEISLEGTDRIVKTKVHDLIIHEHEIDELNEGKKKVLVEFYLEKGSYATMAIRNMVR